MESSLTAYTFNSKTLYGLVAFLVISWGCLMLGFYHENRIFFLLPFAVLIAAISILDFKLLYLLLIFTLPFSKEISLSSSLAINMPSEPLIAGITLLYLCRIIYYKRLQSSILLHPIFLILIIQICWILFSSLQSANMVHSFKYLIAKILYITTFVLVTMDIIQNENDVKKIIWFLFLGTFIATIAVVIAHSFHQFSFEHVNWAASISIFRNHVDYSTTLAVALPFIWHGRKLYSPYSFQRKLMSFGSFLIVFAIITSYTRTSWIALICAIGAYYLIQKSFFKSALILSLVLIGTGVIYLTSHNNYLNYARDYKNIIFHKGDIGGHLEATYKMEDVSGMERLYRWAAAYQMHRNHPLVGTGPNTFYPEYKKYTVGAFTTYVSDNPEKSTTHNYFLMTLSEQGIFGLIILVGLIVYLFFTGINSIYRSNKESHKIIITAAILSLVIIMIHLMLGDMLEVDKVGGVYFICIAILIKMSLLSRKDQPKKQVT